jgi:hypothetical protein
MKKTGVIYLIIALILIIGMLNVPYIVFEHKVAPSVDSFEIIGSQKTLFNNGSSDNPLVWLIYSVLFYPIFLMIEANIWRGQFKIRHRVILIIQCLLLGIGSFCIWFIMTFHLFVKPYKYLAGFYLILSYLILGVICHLFLILPIERFKPAHIIFNKLMLTVNNSDRAQRS